jgi:hypothetical protein
VSHTQLLQSGISCRYPDELSIGENCVANLQRDEAFEQHCSGNNIRRCLFLGIGVESRCSRLLWGPSLERTYRWRAHYSLEPPSTLSVPVTQRASSEARKRIVAAISDGSASRLSAVGGEPPIGRSGTHHRSGRRLQQIQRLRDSSAIPLPSWGGRCGTESRLAAMRPLLSLPPWWPSPTRPTHPTMSWPRPEDWPRWFRSACCQISDRSS